MEKKELTFNNVTKKYKDITALDSFSATLEPGIYGLLGPNGAGKSTLMKCIADIIRPTSGSILYNGKDIYEEGPHFRKILSFMPQELGFYPTFNAVEILHYFAILKDVKLGKDQINEILGNVNLSNYKKKKVGGFSGGMKRRLGIAVTFLNDPEILILDEPTAGLDPEERVRFKQMLADMGKDKIIILATHIVSDIENLADNILFLKKGKLIKIAKGKKENSDGAIVNSMEQMYLDYFG